MHGAYKLDPKVISDAADSVFFWLSVYLFMAAVFIYKTAVTVMRSNGTETLQERVGDGTKLFAGMMIFFGAFIALAASGDVFRLAMTFPSWGVFIVSLILFLAWILVCWFFLNRDDIAAYTIEADQRSSIDEKWGQQTKGKKLLLKELIIWFCGDAFAIAWLMHLTNRGPSSLLSFLHT